MIRIKCLFLILLSCCIFIAKSQTRHRNRQDTLKTLIPQIIRIPVSDSIYALIKYFKLPETNQGILDLPILGRYRFGIQFGTFIPRQKKLIQRFHSIDPYVSIDLISVKPHTGIDFSIDLYNIFNTKSSVSSNDSDHSRNRFFLIGPAVGFEHWFKGNGNIEPFCKVDAQYLIGKLRVEEEGINTSFKSSIAAYFLVGALFSNRYKVNIAYALTNPINGYSLTGFTTSVSYLFMPFGKSNSLQ